MTLAADEMRPTLEIFVDGARMTAQEGDTLAVALLKAGVTPFRRTPISGEPRSPLCLMGVCFECLVDVDDALNVQSCMTEVRAGMEVRLSSGARRPGEPA